MQDMTTNYNELMETYWYACEECGMPVELERTQCQALHLGYCTNPDCSRYRQLTTLVVKGGRDPIGKS